VVVADADCDKTKQPIVVVHGTYGSGDNIGNIALLVGSNGYCQDRFVAVEFNSLGGSPAVQLDALVDKVRADTGFDKVVLMGHSQGTGHCITSLTEAARAEKVSHYINFSGTGRVPNEVPTLSISSDVDIGGMPRHNTNATEVVTYDTADHFTLAASAEAFVTLWTYLYNAAPQYETVQCGQEMVTLEGVAETFGTNTPQAMGGIDVFEVTQSASRDRGTPVMTLQAGTDGHIPPFELERNVPYEFRAKDGNGDLVGYAYFPAFKRSNRLLRFLAPPDSPIVAITTTDNIVKDAKHSAIVFRYIGGSFRPDLGHSLKIDGNEVLSAENTAQMNGTVGMFMYDDNLDGESQLGELFTAPFVVGTDVFVQATTGAVVEIDWNGTIMHIANWPSNEALISVMLP
jgi:pimeloyl-ACP methyl ester carboxylesterase